MRNSVPASLVLEAQAISTVSTTFSATSGKRNQVLHLADGLDLARNADQRDALEAGIAQQLKIGRQAVARLPAADHLLLAVGDHGRRHPRALRRRARRRSRRRPILSARP